MPDYSPPKVSVGKAVWSGCRAEVSMFTHRWCARLSAYLPSLQHYPNSPEDVLEVYADEGGIGTMTRRQNIG